MPGTVAEELPLRMEELVTHLRHRREPLRLGDMAAVTDVLIAAMRTYFRSVDSSMHAEVRALSEFITRAKQEIAALRPHDLKTVRLARAELELGAVVRHTEQATETIMQAAEEIMAADPSDGAGYQSIVNDAVMRVFEACSFQDITGQRIAKVSQTLLELEARLESLAATFGIEERDQPEAFDAGEERRTARLTHGPQLDGEGLNQSLIDALLSDGATPDRPQPRPAVRGVRPTPSARPEPKRTFVEAAGEPTGTPETFDQAAIDALFD